MQKYGMRNVGITPTLKPRNVESCVRPAMVLLGPIRGRQPLLSLQNNKLMNSNDRALLTTNEFLGLADLWDMRQTNPQSPTWKPIEYIGQRGKELFHEE